MWLRLLSALRLSRSERRPVRSKPASVRLAVESLEGRTVPAFLAPVTSPGGGVAVAVGDFNHDGRDDVAAILGTVLTSTPGNQPDVTLDKAAINGKLSVSLSNGDGTFQNPITLTGAKGYYLASFSVRDVNGDGNLDIVAHTTASQPDKLDQPKKGTTTGGVGTPTTYTGYENVWLGKGDGTFGRVSVTTYKSWGPGLYNSLVITADFNRDGIADRARIDGSTPVVSVSLGNNDGTYQPAQTYVAGPSPSRIKSGDFNGDGLIDVLVVNDLSSSSSTLSVLLNNGT